ncbi:hypothetical protein [Sphingobacterium corticibacterium]|uniref:Glycine zipper family protein n=1 Tax=Sphingobacterium corticibacterium TaxID=2484746 RepID=A0A4Q6XXZ4_9SPHI|nr:hypothetical protein [Sphingobacterium corticibacterium]RZF61859.1 hypothetical protein EWE74_03265 [Sphingobacterium corticibacterium]
MRIKSLTPWLFVVFILSTFIACSVVKDAHIQQQTVVSNCNQQNIYDYTEDDMPQPLHTLPIDKTLSTYLSYENLNMANAIGILTDLTSYVRLKNDNNPADLEKRISLLELKQRIDHKINMASLEVSAIASEMDCEEERTSQVANYLKGGESELESKLTVAAIVVGAAGAITTGGVIKNETASNTVGIATGITEASLGLIMLFNNRKIDFYHERNALREVWKGKKVSSNFPPSVWYYLNYNDPTNETPSVRMQIIDKWKNFGQISEEENASIEQIYFGNGGKYTTEQLANRADMYDQLESHITLMKQDLKSLSLALEKL